MLRAPYAQLWEPFMSQYSRSSPYGEMCLLCDNPLVEADHFRTQSIDDNKFLSNHYRTPAAYENNICICGFTDDCFDERLADWTFHLTHYAHRRCFEQHVRASASRVICPVLVKKYRWLGDVPVIDGGNAPAAINVSDAVAHLDQRAFDRVAKLNGAWEMAMSRLLPPMRQRDEARKVLQAYSMFFDGPINKGMRSHFITEVAYDIALSITDFLDAVEPYPDEICMYRGINNEFGISFLDKLKEGDIARTRGFNSQTLSMDAALKFTSMPARIMVLCYTPNAKFLPLFYISQFQREREMLTYPNQQLQFVRKETITGLGMFKASATFYYFNVLPAQFDLKTALHEKQLMITYHYDDVFRKFDANQGLPFETKYKVQVVPNAVKDHHVFVYRDLPLADAYFDALINESPYLISDVIRIFADDAALPRLCLAALARDFTIYEAVVAQIHDRTSEIQSILHDELTRGYVVNQHIAAKHLTPELVEHALSNSASSAEYVGVRTVQTHVLYETRVRDGSMRLDEVPKEYVTETMVQYHCDNVVRNMVIETASDSIDAFLPVLDDVFAANTGVIDALFGVISFFLLIVVREANRVEWSSSTISSTFLHAIRDAHEEDIIKHLKRLHKHALVQLPFELQTPRIINTMISMSIRNVLYCDEGLVDVISVQNQLLQDIESSSVVHNLWYEIKVEELPLKYFNLEASMYVLMYFDNPRQYKHEMRILTVPLFIALAVDIRLLAIQDANRLLDLTTNLERFKLMIDVPDEALLEIYERSFKERVKTFKIRSLNTQMIYNRRHEHKLLEILETFYRPYLNPETGYYFI